MQNDGDKLAGVGDRIGRVSRVLDLAVYALSASEAGGELMEVRRALVEASHVLEETGQEVHTVAQRLRAISDGGAAGLAAPQEQGGVREVQPIRCSGQ